MPNVAWHLDHCQSVICLFFSTLSSPASPCCSDHPPYTNYQFCFFLSYEHTWMCPRTHDKAVFCILCLVTPVLLIQEGTAACQTVRAVINLFVLSSQAMLRSAAGRSLLTDGGSCPLFKFSHIPLIVVVERNTY